MSKRLATKVLVIGWDAADWKVINPLMDAGLMPALEGLVNRGVIGNIATLDPPLSPMLWTSIATSKTADQHGILGFVQPDSEKQSLKPVLGTSRKGKAIWNILSQEDIRSHVVGWWPSHPAEPINGVMVSNFYQQPSGPVSGPWPLPPGTVWPERLSDTLAELRIHPGELTAAHILPFVPRAAEIDRKDDPRLGHLAKMIAECASIHAAATWVMENEPWEFMAVYYDAIDHFSHGFMRYHPPKPDHISEKLYDLYNEVVRSGYRFHDMMLERLLQLAGPDTTVILLSDHGFHSDHLRPSAIPNIPAGPAVEHRNLGVFCMAGPHVQHDERIYGASLLDITPTILTLYGLPIGHDMRGKPLVEAFDRPVSPTYIDSWEMIPGNSGMHAAEQQSDPWAEKAMMDQLIALGYIEPPESDMAERIDQHSREADYYLARVYMANRQPDKALPILERLHQFDPLVSRVATLLARCYHRLNQLGEMRRVIEAITTDQSEQFRPGIDLLHGILLSAEGRPKEALPKLRRAETADPRRPDLHQEIGQAYIQLKEWDAAEQAFEKALDIDGDSAVAYRGLGYVLLQQRRFIDAAEAFLTSIGIIYFQPHSHFWLAEALLQLGEYEHAVDALQVAAAQSRHAPEIHEQLAAIYEQHLNQPGKATEHRRKAAVLREQAEPN